MADPALDRLREIKHIVVLMMENRSFDQMLGYLQLRRHARGRRADRRRVEPRRRTATSPRVFEWGAERDGLPPARGPARQDPRPLPLQGRASQSSSPDGNRRFVTNFVDSRKDRRQPVAIPSTAGCRWATTPPSTCPSTTSWRATTASATPGTARSPATPGRTGCTRSPAARRRVARRLLERLEHLLRRSSRPLENAPIYDVAAFTRQLDDDAMALVLARPGDAARRRRPLPRLRDARPRQLRLLRPPEGEPRSPRPLESPIVRHDSFLDDAANGQLRDVSWIDPNFIDLHVLDPNSNDDHPPSDVRAGQALVLEVYEALATQPATGRTRCWSIVYDEHGGFYDHVAAAARRRRRLGLSRPTACACRRWSSGRGCAAASATSRSTTRA